MLEVIRFLCLVAIAAGSTVSGLVMLLLAKGFGSTHKSDYILGLILLGIGAAIGFYAYCEAPFTIALK